MEPSQDDLSDAVATELAHLDAAKKDKDQAAADVILLTGRLVILKSDTAKVEEILNEARTKQREGEVRLEDAQTTSAATVEKWMNQSLTTQFAFGELLEFMRLEDDKRMAAAQAVIDGIERKRLGIEVHSFSL